MRIIASCCRPFAVFDAVPLTHLALNLSHLVADSSIIDLSVFAPFSLKFWRHRVRMCAPKGGTFASRRRLFTAFNTVPLTFIAPNLSHFIVDSGSIDLSLVARFSLKFWRGVGYACAPRKGNCCLSSPPFRSFQYCSTHMFRPKPLSFRSRLR